MFLNQSRSLERFSFAFLLPAVDDSRKDRLTMARPDLEGRPNRAREDRPAMARPNLDVVSIAPALKVVSEGEQAMDCLTSFFASVGCFDLFRFYNS